MKKLTESPFDLLPVNIAGSEMNTRPVEFTYDKKTGEADMAIKYVSTCPGCSQLVEFAVEDIWVKEDKYYVACACRPVPTDCVGIRTLDTVQPLTQESAKQITSAIDILPVDTQHLIDAQLVKALEAEVFGVDWALEGSEKTETVTFVPSTIDQEDAALIERIKSAPEHKIFTIPVGGASEPYDASRFGEPPALASRFVPFSDPIADGKMKLNNAERVNA